MPASINLIGPLASTRARASRAMGVQRRCKPTHTSRPLRSAASAIRSVSADPAPGGFSMNRWRPASSTATATAVTSQGRMTA